MTIKGGGEGGHLNFFSLNSDFNEVECNKSSLREQDWALKDTCFLFQSKVQNIEGLKQLFKKMSSHGRGGGSQKSDKKCHVLFEWPFIENIQCRKIF